MLGVSFSEIVMIAIVALIVVGPRRLPEILGQMGRWVAKIRRMTSEVRRQTGIDEILREEGISGGINELRSMMRGELNNLQNYTSATPPYAAQAAQSGAVVDAYGESVAYDRLREQPVEGVDSYGAIPEDLLAAAAPVPPPPAPAPAPQLPSPAMERAPDADGAAPVAKGSA